MNPNASVQGTVSVAPGLHETRKDHVMPNRGRLSCFLCRYGVREARWQRHRISPGWHRQSKHCRGGSLTGRQPRGFVRQTVRWGGSELRPMILQAQRVCEPLVTGKPQGISSPDAELRLTKAVDLYGVLRAWTCQPKDVCAYIQGLNCPNISNSD